MTIELPKDIASSIEAAVNRGLFASIDDALVEAWRCFERHQSTPQTKPGTAGSDPDPLLGSMRDYADEMDEIVADAMRRRQDEPWRVVPGG